MPTRDSKVFTYSPPKVGEIWRWHIPDYMADADSPAADEYFYFTESYDDGETYNCIRLGKGTEEEVIYTDKNYVNWYRIS